MKSLVYYITGHGYGHARRSAAVIRRLAADHSDLSIHIRTSAPRRLFDDTVAPRVLYHAADMDPGAVEHDALRIDQVGTSRRVADYLGRRREIVETELRQLPDDLRLIVADIPFLAGDIGAAAGVPVIAIGNFTWDWIYEPWMSGDEEGRRMLAEIQASYASMAAIVKLPFGGQTHMFKRVIDVPVIATGRRYSRDQVLARLGLNARDDRPIVLIGQRGGIAADVLGRAVRAMPDVRFLCPQEMPACAPGNLIAAKLGGELRFADLIYASDAVISKLGHGTVSECIGAGVGMMWSKRDGFREDPVMAEEAAGVLKLREISNERFENGDWAEDLTALLNAPPPPRQMAANGDEVCAGIVGEEMERSKC